MAEDSSPSDGLSSVAEDRTTASALAYSARGEPARHTVLPERIASRYRVDGLLGRGGMAVVYSVTDESTGNRLALKQLAVEERSQVNLAELFEREYHVLAQLAHPRVIEVYDYGIDEHGAYYTMELVSGGDLRERAPMPWQQAVALLYDVCSSLSLLHSRRFVHRDVSPRNVRLTAEGRAKLIDFGAMVPMGTANQLVGTPPFVPPEALSRSALDARSDLYSLGATLYYALTRKLAYPAKDFVQLVRAFAVKPPPPSSFVADIPQALDRLVMSLLSLEPAVRPQSTFEVMERMRVIAGLPPEADLEVRRAYLTTPSLVGREVQRRALRAQLRVAASARGGCVVIEAPSGAGRSRLIDACAFEAKTLKMTVLRAEGASSDEPLGAARAAFQDLVRVLPEPTMRATASENATELLFEPHSSGVAKRAPAVKAFPAASGQAPALHGALLRVFGRVARDNPLVVLADDLHRMDEPSVALLAALCHHSVHRKLLVVATLDSSAAPRAPRAVAVLRGQASLLDLPPLTAEHIDALLLSVFGDVPNLALVCHHVRALAQGNPRVAMDLAQHLVDTGRARYFGGSWRLPEAVSAADFPSTFTDMLAARVEGLSPDARLLAAASALSLRQSLAREHHKALGKALELGQVDALMTELVRASVLAGDGQGHQLAHRELGEILTRGLAQDVSRKLHFALAGLYAGDGFEGVIAVHHLLAAGESEKAVERLLFHLRRDTEEGREIETLSNTLVSLEHIASIYARCLELARSLGRPERDVADIERWLVVISVATEDEHFYRTAPAWLARITRDSGLDRYRELSSMEDEGARITAALTHAFETHTKKPEQERVYPPDQAIKLLVHYVVVAIAIGTRTLDAALLRSLTDLLQPFAKLSPIVALVCKNTLATKALTGEGRVAFAHRMFSEVYAGLESLTGADLRYIDSFRNAIAHALGGIELVMGLPSAMRFAETLDRDPMQRVNSMYLRKVFALQQGDFDAAEVYRKRAEILSLSTMTRSMFTNGVVYELIAHARASDMVGVTQVAERIEALIERAPRFTAYRHLARGYYELMRGDYQEAVSAFERCLETASPEADDDVRVVVAFHHAVLGRTEALVELGRAEEARRDAERAIERWRAYGCDWGSFELRRALALSEAKLGHHAIAAKLCDEVIAEQVALGVIGLNLGASYELRTRIALWAQDRTAVERYGSATAREYRHGRGSALGARYERLMDEARRAGMPLLPQLSELEARLTTLSLGGREATMAVIEQKMLGAEDADERAYRALRLLCDARLATAGHLFLLSKDGLLLRASHHADRPEASLVQLVEAFLSAETQADEAATAVASSQGPSTGMASAHWIDGGASYQPLVLTATIDGVSRAIGVLAVQAGERPVTQVSTALLFDAVGTYLASAGDALLGP